MKKHLPTLIALLFVLVLPAIAQKERAPDFAPNLPKNVRRAVANLRIKHVSMWNDKLCIEYKIYWTPDLEIGYYPIIRFLVADIGKDGECHNWRSEKLQWIKDFKSKKIYRYEAIPNRKHPDWDKAKWKEFKDLKKWLKEDAPIISAIPGDETD